MYVVYKTNTRADHSSAVQKLLNIPWKSICSSKPVHAIVLAIICEALGYSFDYMFSISNRIVWVYTFICLITNRIVKRYDFNIMLLQKYKMFIIHSNIISRNKFAQLDKKGRSVNVITSVSILFVVVLVEFFPKTNCFSTTFVRKFWSCLFFSSRAAFHLLYLSFPQSVTKNFDYFVDIYNAIGVLYCFGESHFSIPTETPVINIL